MRTRKFLQNKLWRDKSIELMENQGSRICWRYLDDAAFVAQLKAKLIEEAQEVLDATSKREHIEELADLLEVIESIAATLEISMNDIAVAQIKKREERGGFMERKFVETAEHPIDSWAVDYCLANAAKYPEIL